MYGFLCIPQEKKTRKSTTFQHGTSPHKIINECSSLHLQLHEFVVVCRVCIAGSLFCRICIVVGSFLLEQLAWQLLCLRSTPIPVHSPLMYPLRVLHMAVVFQPQLLWVFPRSASRHVTLAPLHLWKTMHTALPEKRWCMVQWYVVSCYIQVKSSHKSSQVNTFSVVQIYCLTTCSLQHIVNWKPVKHLLFNENKPVPDNDVAKRAVVVFKVCVVPRYCVAHLLLLHNTLTVILY